MTGISIMTLHLNLLVFEDSKLFFSIYFITGRLNVVLLLEFDLFLISFMTGISILTQHLNLLVLGGVI